MELANIIVSFFLTGVVGLYVSSRFQEKNFLHQIKTNRSEREIDKLREITKTLEKMSGERIYYSRLLLDSLADKEFKLDSDILKPKYTLLGNAKSEHLEYSKYKKYGKTITNNQGGNIVLEVDKDGLNILVENYTFAKDNHNMNGLHKKEIANKTYYYMDIIGG